MEGSLKTWDGEKQQWDQAERDTRSALENKEQKLGAVSDEIRKIVSENKGLKDQVDSFPSKLSLLNARVQELLKENAMLHYNLGVIYTERQAYPEAIREFEKALDNRPDDAYAHYNLGIIYSQYEINEAKAVEHFSKYLKFAPKDDKDANMARKYLFTRESYELEKHP
jgi:tetratricopeptide (TPR) repeat protein